MTRLRSLLFPYPSHSFWLCLSLFSSVLIVFTLLLMFRRPLLCERLHHIHRRVRHNIFGWRIANIFISTLQHLSAGPTIAFGPFSSHLLIYIGQVLVLQLLLFVVCLPQRNSIVSESLSSKNRSSSVWK